MPSEHTGKVYLVGAGPGEADLLTVRAARCLAQAQVLVHDRLVDDSVLALAPRDCERVYAGKRKHVHAMSQQDLNGLLVARARAGVRECSGCARLFSAAIRR